MIVYKATSPSNKVYIGITIKKLSDRKKQHKFLAKNGKKTKFYTAIRKYGFESFKWEIIYQTNDHKDLLEKEQYFIKLYNTQIKGYNLTSGGEGTIGYSTTKGKKLDPIKCLKNRNIKRQQYGKPVVCIDLNTKLYVEYNSIAECSEKINENYTIVKNAVKNNYCVKNFKIVLKDNFNPNNKDLFESKKSPNSKKFYITNGIDYIFIESINHLRRFLNISERTARNIYYKQLDFNGWKKDVTLHY